ncbi:discoidin domain-containing protein [Bacillus sp. FJAT-52991]|uniref:Discoidin domain-containing protein n=1 Tax=Bacillus kandeliae TaxID=3129297 RepID=A0ABZ2N2B7_9BACI
MAYELKITEGTALLSENNLVATKQARAMITTNNPFLKEKFYFEITFDTGGYKSIGFDVLYPMYSGSRDVGTFGFEVDHSIKAIKAYKNGVLNKESTYTQDTIPQIKIYMNEDSKTTFNFGITLFKYASPQGFPSVESMDRYLFQDGNEIKKYNKSIAPSFKNITPIMTGPDTPIPYVVSANAYYGNNAPWKVFDDDTLPGSWWLANTTRPPEGHWLKIDLGIPKKIGKIELSTINIGSGSVNGFSIKDWILYGSNDDVTYEELTRNSHPDNINVIPYSFDNSSSYRYYRINFLNGYNMVIYPNAACVKIMKIYEILQEGQKAGWTVAGTSPVTKSMFDFYGMTDLSIITNESLRQLASENPELLCWIDEESAQRNLNVTAIPQDQLVLPTKDIDIRSVENIDSFTLNATQAGQGAVKTAVSFDSGTTWYTRLDGAWVQLDLVNMKTEGMAPATLNALTSADWVDLRGASNTVRFAYHLSMEEVTDIVAVNDLISQMDMKGTWKKAVHGTDYDYEYPNNDQLTVTIYQSGDYKINY